MHQVKLFRGLENDLPGLEKQVNKWLEESGARVVSIRTNMAPQSASQPERTISGTGGSIWAPSDVLVMVHYEK